MGHQLSASDDVGRDGVRRWIRNLDRPRKHDGHDASLAGLTADSVSDFGWQSSGLRIDHHRRHLPVVDTGFDAWLATVELSEIGGGCDLRSDLFRRDHDVDGGSGQDRTIGQRNRLGHQYGHVDDRRRHDPSHVHAQFYAKPQRYQPG